MAKLEDLSQSEVVYFEPKDVDIDFLLYNLSEGDISKISIIQMQSINDCMSYYYMNKIRSLNKMKYEVSEIEKLKN